MTVTVRKSGSRSQGPGAQRALPRAPVPTNHRPRTCKWAAPVSVHNQSEATAYYATQQQQSQSVKGQNPAYIWSRV
ncbi:unnamed protein product [Merluccius merluccius]